jgi:eukaryotic-like serine/threonine-protein kinase
MADDSKCLKCGAPLTPDAHNGICPKCLLEQALANAQEGESAEPSLSAAPDEGLSSVIGRYKLLEKIGEGAFGMVFMAEQTEPIRRLVALKVIKPGMDSAQLLARFEAERQALALMDHPNIARILDAGTAPSGRPYFVMDLVKGIRLTDFCDEQRLSVRERLELFMQVCQAVQHAHQKGIIHRDLKPSNVLVALYDGRPVPKVIDFGVAKAMGQPLTERTLHTAFGAVVGTLQYMSPEQAEFNQLDIDTRSDIYSLGVLLYELLTGTTPLTHEALRQAAFEEILRRIREEEPPEPSLRLSTSGERLQAISAQRKLDREKLTKVVRGELDWIVMKALEKERDQRYETANAFALDLQRYLKDETVMAGPPSNIYRFRKLVRRNRALFIAVGAVVAGMVAGGLIGPSVVSSVQVTAAVAMALFIGLAIAAWLFVRESRARQRAVQAKAAEQQAHRKTQDALSQMEVTKAEECLSNNQVSTALAYLARVLRMDQEHRVAADMLLATLAYRGLALPRSETERPTQKGFVNSAEFSPDGARVVTTFVTRAGNGSDWDNYEGYAQVWDARTGLALSPPMNHNGYLRSAQFSPDGQRVLTAYNEGAAADSDRRKGYAQVWDASTGQALFQPIALNGEVNSAQFSPDGTCMVTACGNKAKHEGCVQVWNSHTGQPLAPPLEFDDAVESASFSPDSQYVLTVSGTKACLWNAQRGQQLAQRLEHKDKVSSAQFSPDGRRVVTSYCDPTTHEGYAQVWDASAGQPLTPPLRHEAEVKSAQFSPDGQRVVTACAAAFSKIRGGYARVWDAHTGQALTQPMMHEDEVYSVQFSPDGLRVITACRWLWSSESYARVWDTQTGRPLTAPLRDNNPVRSARFSPDGQWVVTASGCHARVWDVRSGRALSATVKYDGQVLAFSMDGQLVAIGSADSVRVCDVRTGQALTEPLKNGGRVTFARFSPDRRWVVTISTNEAQVWDVGAGQARTGSLKHDSKVGFADFSPDSERLVTTSGTSAWLWSVRTGELFTQPLKHDGEVEYARFSSDGRRLVTACQLREFYWEARDTRTGSARLVEGYAQVWDAQTGEPVTNPLEHGSWVNSAQFSSDGRLVVTACGDLATRQGYARVWDARTGQPLTGPLNHNDVVRSAEFSSDDRLVVTACGYSMGYAQVWDARTGHALTDPLKHDGRMECAHCSPENERIVTACCNVDKRKGYARVWDAHTGQALTDPLKNSSSANCVACAQFSPEGHQAVIASWDRTTGVWDIPTASMPVPSWLPQLAESIAGQCFNERRSIDSVPCAELMHLRKKLETSSGTDVSSLWAKWFFADRSTRTISPFSSITIPEYIQRRIEENTLESLREAVSLSPTNGLAYARLAKQVLTQSDEDNPRRIGEADFFSRYAVKWSPNDAEVAKIRTEIEEHIKSLPKP